MFKKIYYLCKVKHSEIKQNIIETASSLFYKNGYNSTGINQIISESGIAKATLYYHFKSKEDICLAYLNFKNVAFLNNIEKYSKTKEGKLQIIAIFDFLELFFKDENFNGCWCVKTVSEISKDNEKIRNEIQNQKALFLQFITNLVSTNLKNKEEKEIDSLAKQIYLIYESAVTESHLHQADWPIKEAKNLCSKIIG